MNPLRIILCIAIMCSFQMSAMELATHHKKLMTVIVPFVVDPDAFFAFIEDPRFDETPATQLAILYDRYPRAQFFVHYDEVITQAGCSWIDFEIDNNRIVNINHLGLKPWEYVAIMTAFFAADDKNEAAALKSLAKAMVAPEIYDFLRFMYLHENELRRRLHEFCIKLAAQNNTEREEVVKRLTTLSEQGQFTNDVLEDFFVFLPLGIPKIGSINYPGEAIQLVHVFRQGNDFSSVQHTLTKIHRAIANDLFFNMVTKDLFGQLLMQPRTKTETTKVKKKGRFSSLWS